MTKAKDWFDDHVIVAGTISDDFAAKLKKRLRQEVARKYGHKETCECPFCHGALTKAERDLDQ